MGFFDKFTGGGKRRDFGESLVTRLTDQQAILEVTLEDEPFGLHLRDAIGNYDAPLATIFEELQELTDEEAEVVVDGLVEQLVRFENGIPKQARHATAGLFPVVHYRGYYDNRVLDLMIERGIEIFVPHAEPVDAIGIDLVWHNGDELYPIESPQLKRWGVEFDELMAIAVNNMKRYRTKRWTQPQSRVHVSPWRTPFDASMILFADWIADLRIIGDPVIMIPTREQMIVTGSSDLAGLTAMAEMIEDHVSDGNAFLTLTPFTIKDQRVVPFRLPDGHNLSHRFKLMEMESKLRDYTHQKTVLDRWFAANGKRAIVADWTGIENQNRRELHSYCIWPSQSQPVYLPVTDKIYFVDDVATGKVTRIFPWDAVQTTLPGAFQSLEMWPPRYKVEGYPSEDQFRECVHNS